MNPKIGSGTQQARNAQVEQAVEVVRNGMDGTSRGAGSPRPKHGARVVWEWTPGAQVDGGTVFENPKRGSSQDVRSDEETASAGTETTNTPPDEPHAKQCVFEGDVKDTSGEAHGPNRPDGALREDGPRRSAPLENPGGPRPRRTSGQGHTTATSNSEGEPCCSNPETERRSDDEACVTEAPANTTEGTLAALDAGLFGARSQEPSGACTSESTSSAEHCENL